MQKILFPLLCLVILSACKNETINSETDEIAYPKTYTGISYTDIGKERVFTRDGEITDEAIIQKTLNKYSSFLMDLSQYDTNDSFSINYSSSEEAEINNFGSNSAPDKRSVVDISGVDYLEKKDTSVMIGSLLDNIKHFKFKPLFFKEEIVPFNSGVRTITKFKESNYLRKDNKEAKFPMLDFVLFNVNQYNSAKRLNNEFDINSISDLNTNDTLLIREYKVLMN